MDIASLLNSPKSTAKLDLISRPSAAREPLKPAGNHENAHHSTQQDGTALVTARPETYWFDPAKGGYTTPSLVSRFEESFERHGSRNPADLNTTSPSRDIQPHTSIHDSAGSLITPQDTLDLQERLSFSGSPIYRGQSREHRSHLRFEPYPRPHTSHVYRYPQSQPLRDQVRAEVATRHHARHHSQGTHYSRSSSGGISPVSFDDRDVGFNDHPDHEQTSYGKHYGGKKYQTHFTPDLQGPSTSHSTPSAHGRNLRHPRQVYENGPSSQAQNLHASGSDTSGSDDEEDGQEEEEKPQRLRRAARNFKALERLVLFRADHWCDGNICRGCGWNVKHDPRPGQKGQKVKDPKTGEVREDAYKSAFVQHRDGCKAGRNLPCAGIVLRVEIVLDEINEELGTSYTWESPEIRDCFWDGDWSQLVLEKEKDPRIQMPEPLWLRVHRRAAQLKLPGRFEKRDHGFVYYNKRLYKRGDWAAGKYRV